MEFLMDDFPYGDGHSLRFHALDIDRMVLLHSSLSFPERHSGNGKRTVFLFFGVDVLPNLF
jgi:hypothetical protein